MPTVVGVRKSGAPAWLRPLTSAPTHQEVSFAFAVRRASERLAQGFNFAEAVAGYSPGEVAAVVSQMPWEDYGAALNRLEGHLGATFTDAGTLGATGLGFAFDVVNPRAIAYAHTHAADLVVEITDSTRAGLNTLITNAFVRGTPPAELAAQIRNSVGLHSRWATAVANYRTRMLARGVTPAKVEAMAAKYSARLVKARSLNIARTEIMKASNAGRYESFLQAQQNGLVSGKAVKEWQAASEACPICAPVDGMQVPLTDVFPTSGGNFDYPPAHPSCRCTIVMLPGATKQPTGPLPDLPQYQPHVPSLQTPSIQTGPQYPTPSANYTDEAGGEWPTGTPEPGYGETPAKPYDWLNDEYMLDTMSAQSDNASVFTDYLAPGQKTYYKLPKDYKLNSVYDPAGPMGDAGSYLNPAIAHADAIPNVPGSTWTHVNGQMWKLTVDGTDVQTYAIFPKVPAPGSLEADVNALIAGVTDTPTPSFVGDAPLYPANSPKLVTVVDDIPDNVGAQFQGGGLWTDDAGNHYLEVKYAGEGETPGNPFAVDGEYFGQHISEFKPVPGQANTFEHIPTGTFVDPSPSGYPGVPDVGNLGGTTTATTTAPAATEPFTVTGGMGDTLSDPFSWTGTKPAGWHDTGFSGIWQDAEGNFYKPDPIPAHSASLTETMTGYSAELPAKVNFGSLPSHYQMVKPPTPGVPGIYYDDASDAFYQVALPSDPPAIVPDVLDLTTPVRSTDAPADLLRGLKPAPAEEQISLGMHSKTVYVDSDGNLWLFKPSRVSSPEAYAEELGNAIRREVSVSSTEAYVAEVDGQIGSLQKLYATAEKRREFVKGAMQVEKLSPEATRTLQENQVLDWLIGNHDAHADQFIRVSGSLDPIETDFGQAFKFFGKDRLAYDYTPNPSRTIYSYIDQGYATGSNVSGFDNLALQPDGTLAKFIREVQHISDQDYADMLRPYAEAAKKSGMLPTNDVETFIRLAVERKNSLMQDFTDYHNALLAERAKYVPVPAPLPAELASYQRFSSYHDVQTWGQNSSYSKWPDELPSTQASAVKSYTGGGYRDVNLTLRTGSSGGTTVTNKIKNITKALESKPIPDNVVSFRGAGNTELQDILTKAGIDLNAPVEQLIGREYNDWGFLSTSVAPQGGFGGALRLEVHVPAGTPGAYLQWISNYASEYELLLQRGLRYRILGVERSGGVTKLIVQVVGQDTPVA
jgi:hypothetical protein